MPPNSDLPPSPALALPPGRAGLISRRANLPVFSSVKRTAEGRRKARRVIAFVQALTVPSGFGQGKCFKLDKWQRDFIKDIYEPRRRNGRRAVRRAILSVARKNGKPALIAGITLAKR
jgi:phage terminase large subunit-like protein